MIHMKLFLKSPPITPKKWRVDCSATVGRMVVCVLCAGRESLACACFGLSLSTRGVLGPTIKPRGSGCRLPAIRGLSKALRGNYPSTVMTPIGTWHLHYKGKIVVGEIL